MELDSKSDRAKELPNLDDSEEDEDMEEPEDNGEKDDYICAVYDKKWYNAQEGGSRGQV